jgi:branched-chain amino acid transport system permease protein
MIAQQLLNGLSTGCVYALFSLGFNLIFGLQGVLNLAHGALFTWGAFVSLYATRAGASIYVALLLAILASGCLAILLELLVFRQLRLRKANEFSAIAASIGAGMVLVGIAQEVSDTQIMRFVTDVFPSDVYQVLGLRISLLQVVIGALTLAFLVALLAFVYHTTFGKEMRALSVDERTARLLGVNPGPIYLLTFFISGAMAGAAGVMIGVRFNYVHFLMGEPFFLYGLVAVVMGGLGSMAGAVVASILLGLAQTVVVMTPYSGFSDAIVFALLFIVLLVRPAGLFGGARSASGPAL